MFVKISTPSKTLFLSCLLLMGFAPVCMAQAKIKYEKELEAYAREIVTEQIPDELYFVDVAVSSDVESASESNAGGQSALPFVTLKTDLSYLKKTIDRAIDLDIFKLSYAITLVVDTSVPETNLELIRGKLERRMLIDGAARTLDVKSAALVPEQQVQQVSAEKERIELERSRLENQQSQLQNERTRVELEREKFEAAKREAELRADLQRTRDQSQEEVEKMKEQLAAEAGAVGTETAKEKSLLDLLQDFQFIIIAIVAAIALLLMTLLGAGSHRKGLSSLSSAIQAMGEGFSANQPAPAAPEKAPVADPDTPPVAAAATVDGGVSRPEEPVDSRYQEFLNLVEEKIEVLSAGGNFNFYRHFIDMIEENVENAAAILVSVSATTSRKLAGNLSPDHMQIVKNYLSQQGAMERAQKTRRAALQSFYGRIAVDEYMDSPLSSMNDAGWIARLSTKDLIGLVFELDAGDRTAFLACFTATRLALMLQLVDDGKRQMLIDTIKDVDTVASSTVADVVKKAQQVYLSKQDRDLDKVRTLVDGPQFYAKILADLSPENRSSFLSSLAQRKELYDQIKKYYIPFSSIVEITPTVLKDIFGRRPASQVAAMIFVADQAIKDAVIQAMPEALRETVQEEIETLISDDSSRKKNETTAYRLQDEVCRYLLQLNKEGLLEYIGEQDAAPSRQAPVNAA